MKKIKHTLTFVVILITILLACNDDQSNSSADGSESSNVIAQYENIDFEKQEYEIPEELIYHKKGQDFLYDKLFPIGWSKNGKFAYIIEPADEASGLYWFEFVILDIVNNKVDYTWKPKETEEGSVGKLWKENYELFRKNLRSSQIMQMKDFTLLEGKTSYKSSEYEILLDAKTENDPDFGFDVIKEVEIIITSKELGEKKILNQKNTDYSLVLGAYIQGYLLSPFDDRIVVVYQKERAGYEGPPNVVFFDLIGTDLTRGFKKGKESL
jgi:hypothetical protein